MIKLTVLYGPPQDPGAFDRHYQEVHVPLALKMPGVKGFTGDKPMAINPQEQSPYYFIATLYWENMQAFQEAFQSPEGQAAVDDLQNFATGSVTSLVGEVQVYDPVSLS